MATRKIIVCRKCGTSRPPNLGDFGACPICYKSRPCKICGREFIDQKELTVTCGRCRQEKRQAQQAKPPKKPKAPPTFTWEANNADRFWETPQETIVRREQLKERLRPYWQAWEAVNGKSSRTG